MKLKNIEVGKVYKFKSKKKCEKIFAKKSRKEYNRITLDGLMNPLILEKLYSKNIIVTHSNYMSGIFELLVRLESDKSIAQYVPSYFIKEI